MKLPPLLFLAVLLASVPLSRAEDDILRIAGSSTVGTVVSEAAQILRVEQSMDVQINTSGGSTAGIGALGEGSAALALSTREVTPEDRAEFPDVNFQTIYLGEQAIALIVSRDVFEAGLYALSPEEMRGIYEKKTTNWKTLKGPDRAITFYTTNEGRGVWEIFATWIYGSTSIAPLGRFPTVTNFDEARDSVAYTRGSISLAPPAWADDKETFAISLKSRDHTAAPKVEKIAKGEYPMTRPLYLIVNNRPLGPVKTIVDLLFSERGVALMKKHGFITADEMKAAGREVPPRPE